MATTKRPTNKGPKGGSKKTGSTSAREPAAGRGKTSRERPRIHSSHGSRVIPAPRGEASIAARKDKEPKGAKDAKGPKKAGRATDSPSVATDDARELATWIAVAALDKKAVGLEILDVAGKVDYADFLILMTGRSDRQVVALSQGIEDALKKKNRRPLSVEGLPVASWVLMDYGDVVVHVFQDDARGLYDLEGLWMDARRLPVPLPDGIR
ncbi:MAG: ribosome silencing factor [Polyangiaceae bacterium]